MKIKDIPFADYVGVKSEKNTISLDFRDEVINHVKTIHASAQFTLAETKSGMYLIEKFPELEGKVIPLLRDAQVKYKKPALENIYAQASISQESIDKFTSMFEKKGRANISVDVQVKDINEVLCSEASFSWFIQKV